MSAWDLTFIGIVMTGVSAAIIIVAGMYAHAYGYADSPCAPGRRANITASVQQRPRRILAELEPPAGWRDTFTVQAAAPVKLTAWTDCEEWDEDEDDDLDDIGEWIDDAEPELVPVPVPMPHPQPPQPMGIPVEWPTRIVQPVPLTKR